MKRSEINQALRQTKAFLEKMGIHLPKWASWAPEDWKGRSSEVAEIVTCSLGWDITDFSTGDFRNTGLISFTPRNGVLNRTQKQYCEKIMVVNENQVTPFHTHRSKVEDIINRGGGNLVLEMYAGDLQGKIDAQKSIHVKIDSIEHTFAPGEKVALAPGESICLTPGNYHKFYGESGKGMVLVGEVSSVNDDNTDNIFVEPLARFPEIEEDEAPIHLLVNDYPKYL